MQTGIDNIFWGGILYGRQRKEGKKMPFAFVIRNSDILLASIIVTAILIVAYVIGVLVSLPFVIRENRMLTIEIGRTEGKEKEHYKKKKRRLWLSLLPFVRYK